MPMKPIPFKQALALHELQVAMAECQGAVVAIQQLAAAHQRQLLTALEFAGIPVDKPLQLKIEAGPDAEGNVAIEWADPPEPKEPGA